MALHHDLLEQSKHLARREPKRPRQASLRRSVSAAYYALFHLLAAEAAARLTPQQPVRLRLQMRRAFTHQDMKAVCKFFAQGALKSLPESTRHLISGAVESEIKSVAGLFVEMQEARHLADYDHTTSLMRAEALQTVKNVEQAFRDWQAIRTSTNATVFLAALMLQRQWSR
jgi:hypothetical protein